MTPQRRLVPIRSKILCCLLVVSALFLHTTFAFQQPAIGSPSRRISVPTISRRATLINPIHSRATSLNLTPLQGDVLINPIQPRATALNLTPLQGDVLRTAFGAALAAKVSLSGLRKKESLRTSGAVAAFAVAAASLACSIRSGSTLLFFYSTSSKLTRLGSSKKQTLEEDYKVGGKRGANQVLSCSLIGVAAAIARRLLVGSDSPLDFGNLLSLGNRLTLAYVAFFASCAGDTWASELGVLSKSDPRLVTTWKKVAPGTNGGVSKVGLAASAAGGLAMGLLHGLLLPLKYSLNARAREVLVLGVVGLLGGLGGSMLDSLLGATIQITHYDPVEKIILKKPKEGSIRLGFSLLSNEMVNVVSTGATALLAAFFAGPLLSLV